MCAAACSDAEQRLARVRKALAWGEAAFQAASLANLWLFLCEGKYRCGAAGGQLACQELTNQNLLAQNCCVRQWCCESWPCSPAPPL